MICFAIWQNHNLAPHGTPLRAGQLHQKTTLCKSLLFIYPQVSNFFFSTLTWCVEYVICKLCAHTKPFFFHACTCNPQTHLLRSRRIRHFSYLEKVVSASGTISMGSAQEQFFLRQLCHHSDVVLTLSLEQEQTRFTIKLSVLRGEKHSI